MDEFLKNIDKAFNEKKALLGHSNDVAQRVILVAEEPL